MTKAVYKNWPAIIILLLILTVLLVMVWPSHASTTVLTGTLKDAQGSPINGTLVLQLPVPAQDTSTNTAVANTPVTFRLVNGVITGGAPLFDVANLQPQNLYYSARAYDNSGALVFTGNYSVTGGTYNLGAAVPTSITTNNISFVNPAVTNGSNTFTGTQAFNGQIISTVVPGTPPFSVSSNTLVPVLNVSQINGVNIGGTPSAGMVPVASSSTSATWTANSLSGYKMECVNVTPVTVANSVALSPLQTCTIPANDIGVAQTFYVDAEGIAGATGTPTLTVQVYLDAVQIGGNFQVTCAAATNQGWTLRMPFTGVTTGAGGTVTPGALLWMSSASIGGLTTNSTAASNSPNTVNTTVSHTIQIQIQWGAASASNTITGQSFTVYRIG